jgi:hypothetical protein
MTDEANTLLFLGDVVPHKAFRFKTRYKTVINLECPIVVGEAYPANGKINLSVHSNYLTDIFKSKLEIACLANNHIFDFGLQALNSTIHQLEERGIKWFGIDRKPDERLSHLLYEMNDQKIALIAAVCPSTSPLTEIDGPAFINLLDVDVIISKVEKLRAVVDRIVLYVHWGEEELSYPKKEDIITARKLVDSGVDILIGSHAHSPQDIEKYNGGIIAYNLGNFIMPALKNIPSYFDNNGKPHAFYNKLLMPWNRISWGLLVNMETLSYRIKKYIFLFDRIIELPFTPFDKYIYLKQVTFDDNYDRMVNRHLKKREKFSKIMHYIAKPYIPQKIKKRLWN